MPFVHRVRVRSHECDHQGIVFNGTWLAYIDVTLTELWRAAFGSYMNAVDDGMDVVVVDARLRFLGPARFDEELEAAFAIERLGTTSMSAAVGARRDGDTLLEAQMVYVFIDPATIAKLQIPPAVRERLQPWVTGSGDP